MTSIGDFTLLEPAAGRRIDLGLGCLAGTVHAFRTASDRPARQLVVGPVEVAELIAELGECPRERWEEVHERHRSHYATEPA